MMGVTSRSDGRVPRTWRERLQGWRSPWEIEPMS